MENSKLKIAIVVPGRFDAFDFAAALLDQGHKAALFTNYPKWAVKRFGIPPCNVASFLQHGVISRIAWFLQQKVNIPYPEAWLHKMFGRWAAKELSKESWDVVHCWSGISEEVFRVLKGKRTLKILMRGSSHISTQARILEEEEKRAGVPMDKPSAWMIEREKREYDMADYIRVLSKFAHQSFIENGIDEIKLLDISSGVSIRHFQPTRDIVDQRRRRILNNGPLRVLYVGALSFQKGIRDLKEIICKLDSRKFKFCLIGPITRESKSFMAGFPDSIELIHKRPQRELSKWYAKADIFIFPTLQDGYAVVLAQAQAAGLPIIVTTNCAGPDIVNEGKTGWVLPIREPGAFIEKLLWCDSHRNELAGMAEDIHENYKPKDWHEIAGNFTDICADLKEKHK